MGKQHKGKGKRGKRKIGKKNQKQKCRGWERREIGENGEKQGKRRERKLVEGREK